MVANLNFNLAQKIREEYMNGSSPKDLYTKYQNYCKDIGRIYSILNNLTFFDPNYSQRISKDKFFTKKQIIILQFLKYDLDMKWEEIMQIIDKTPTFAQLDTKDKIQNLFYRLK